MKKIINHDLKTNEFEKNNFNGIVFPVTDRYENKKKKIERMIDLILYKRYINNFESKSTTIFSPSPVVIINWPFVEISGLVASNIGITISDGFSFNS